MIPSHTLTWKKSFLRLKDLLLHDSRRLFVFVALLLLLFSQQSCETLREELAGHASISNEHEGGNSAVTNRETVGLGLGLNIIAHTPAVYKNSAERDDDYFTPQDNEGIALRTSLEFTQKGSKLQDSKTTLNYLELAEDVYYQYKLPNNSTLFGGIGPYFAYGIGGKAGNSSGKVSSFGGPDGYKRFDAGLNLLAGYRLPSGLFFDLSYDFGLVNKSPAPDFSSRNRSFSLGIGYSIDMLKKGGKKK